MNLLAAALLLLATPPSADASPAEPRVEYARRTILDFTGAEISGEVERPQHAYVLVRSRARFKTLIRVRGGFLPEIARSADSLR